MLKGLVSVVLLMLFTSFMPVRRAHYALTKVVIDAGHGGHDAGCLGRNGGKEKDVALDIALKLGEYIEANFKDVQVIYTRKTDVFVELHDRAAIANNAKADLFICVHCNSACYRDKKIKREICSEGTYGAETWVMGLNKSEANLEVAKRENEVVLMEKDYTAKYDGFNPNSPEANIIFSLYQNAFMDQSLKLASLVQQELKEKGRPTRGVKQAGFLVLYKTTMPSILIETGFLTNAVEEKYLLSGKGQDEVAHAIFNAFKTYKRSVESGTQAEEEKPRTETVAGTDTAPKKIQPDKSLTIEEIKPEGKPASENQELFYTVQILTSSSPLNKSGSRFKGVEVWDDKIQGIYKYCTGKTKKFSDAVSLQKEMKDKGFIDAFVVVYHHGQRITLQEAKKIAGFN